MNTKESGRLQTRAPPECVSPSTGSRQAPRSDPEGCAGGAPSVPDERGGSGRGGLPPLAPASRSAAVDGYRSANAGVPVLQELGLAFRRDRRGPAGPAAGVHLAGRRALRRRPFAAAAEAVVHVAG